MGLQDQIYTTMSRRGRRVNRDAELEELCETITNAANMRHSTPAQPPTPAINLDQLVEALQAGSTGSKKQIKAPVFTGVGDVEMFIQQFMDIAHANRWDEREILLHFRLNLTEKAQECGQFDKTEDVLEELRSRFGITFRQARDKLDLRHKLPSQGIHELGMEISKLVKLAYPNMSAADREDMAMDRFAKVMNNVELSWYLMPLRPTSMWE